MLYLGIDPGVNGGMAILTSGGNGYHLYSMPTYDRDLWKLLGGSIDDNLDTSEPLQAVIEQVQGYFTGSKANIGTAMFTFGQSYGAIRMALTAAGIPFEEVAPKRWQRDLGITSKWKEPKAAHKRRLYILAKELFPDVRGITLKTCDALLLAEWLRRQHEGKENVL